MAQYQRENVIPKILSNPTNRFSIHHTRLEDHILDEYDRDTYAVWHFLYSRGWTYADQKVCMERLGLSELEYSRCMKNLSAAKMAKRQYLRNSKGQITGSRWLILQDDKALSDLTAEIFSDSHQDPANQGLGESHLKELETDSLDRDSRQGISPEAPPEKQKRVNNVKTWTFKQRKCHTDQPYRRIVEREGDFIARHTDRTWREECKNGRQKAFKRHFSEGVGECPPTQGPQSDDGQRR